LGTRRDDVDRPINHLVGDLPHLISVCVPQRPLAAVTDTVGTAATAAADDGNEMHRHHPFTDVNTVVHGRYTG
jgi:hypothetical protein